MNFLRIGLMFRILKPNALVEVMLDGEPLKLQFGISLAAALIAAEQIPMRHNPVSGAPRAAYCMMGSCFECVIEVDGVNLRACQIQVAEGLLLRRAGIDANNGSVS